MDLAIDPLGRTVQLTEERWSHIIEGHPYMAPFRADVMRATEAPTHLIEQPRPGQDWFTYRTRDPVGGSRS
jgi:hypothetical protein